MEGEGVVLGLLVVRRRVVVLFHRVVLAVSSSRVPVDASSLSRCFGVGRSSFCGKRVQVVVVFMRGGGRFCVGVRSRYFGVLLVVWAVVFAVWAVMAARRWWVVVGVGRGRCGSCCRVAVVVCCRSVVCWCVRLDWLGWDWDWDTHQLTTNDDFIVRCLFAMSLTATWHLEGALARGTDRDDLLWRVTTLCVVTVR